MAAPLAAGAPIPQMGFIGNTLTPVIKESIRLLPDGIVIASGFFALVTLSFPYAVFFASMVEATFLYRLIAYLASFLNIAYPELIKDRFSSMCRTGFSTADINTLSMFRTSDYSPFPSAPLFMLSTAASYLFGTLNRQSKELEALGPAYSSRYYLSFMLLSMLLIIFSIYRVYYNCDSFGIILMTIPIGFMIGNFLVYQNRRLLGANGEQSINLLGIPLLRNRAANGQRLYVCATQVGTTKVA